MRLALVITLAACGSRAGGGTPTPDGDIAGDLDALRDDAVHDAVPGDAGSLDAPGFPAKLDVQIKCRNDCVLIANPSAIAAPAGAEFTVNWINTGDTECDVAKIDPFNQVPIIIGLEPGTSYHDSVRKWCGTFTGTFQFRVTICTIHSYIPVTCGP